MKLDDEQRYRPLQMCSARIFFKFKFVATVKTPVVVRHRLWTTIGVQIAKDKKVNAAIVLLIAIEE
jgi:hypothetical protein